MTFVDTTSLIKTRVGCDGLVGLGFAKGHVEGEVEGMPYHFLVMEKIVVKKICVGKKGSGKENF